METSGRHCLTLDLKDDPELIKAYEKYHLSVWPEIIKSIKDSGILNMEIYRFSNRLFMIIETDKSFSFEKKKIADECNSFVRDWENLMSKYQQQLPGSLPGEKWKVMKLVFTLN